MNWKDIVKSVAPVLGTALGGPLAGTALKVLAGELLGNESSTEKDIEEAILSASPEQLIALRKTDNDFKVKMKELDIDVIELDAKNTDSARDMAKANMWPQITLSALFVTGYFVIVYFLIASNVKISEATIIIIGVITAAIPQILNFWFGSTQGSKDKTNIMSNFGREK